MKEKLFMDPLCIFLLLSCLTVSALQIDPLAVQIGATKTTLTMVDITTQPDNEILKIGDSEFRLQTTWAVFALTEAKEYNLSIWDIAGNCGCSNQVCGQDCPGVRGKDCDSSTFNKPASCWLSAAKGYCWSFVKTGSTQNFTLYNLSHINTLALTSYGGPNTPFTSPGFTIQSRLEHQNYSWNAMIIGAVSHQKSSLSEVRYAESEGRLISLERFRQLSSPPSLSSIAVDLNKSTCPEEGHPVFETKKLIQNPQDDDQVDFRYYMLLRKAPVIIVDLSNRFILTPTGLLKWSKQKLFDIFDPCNQQFLTLQTDQMNNYFTILPDTQKLIKDDIICIAISDIKTNPSDLVLYELKNGDNLWKPSDRFRGFLSNDYVEKLDLRITEKSTLPIVPPKAEIEVDFIMETDRPIVRLMTTSPLECQIYISPNCVITMKTSQEQGSVQKFIEQSCGSWYQVGRYFCEGVSGNFYPPSQFVSTPISGFVENTTVSVVSVATSSSVNIVPIPQSWFARRWRNITPLEIRVGFALTILTATIVFKKYKKSLKLSMKTKIDLAEENDKLIKADESFSQGINKPQGLLQRAREDYDPIEEYVKTKRMRNGLYRMWEDSIIYTDSDSKKDS